MDFVVNTFSGVFVACEFSINSVSKISEIINKVSNSGVFQRLLPRNAGMLGITH